MVLITINLFVSNEIIENVTVVLNNATELWLVENEKERNVDVETINLGGDRCLIHLEKKDYETFANFIKEEEHNQQERNYLAQHVAER